MIANILIAVGFGFIGIATGAMVLDRYHNERTEAYTAMADNAEAQRHATAAELAAVRVELARSESLVDALSREIAYLKSQRTRAEALHAERIRDIIEGTVVVWPS